MKILALLMILSLPLLYMFFYEFEPFMAELQARQDAREQQETILTGDDPSLELEMPAAGNSKK